MPALYNTVGNLRFYNFISNQYPAGVPVGLVRQFVSNASLNRWMNDYAFDSIERFITDSDRRIHFYFKRATNEPCDNETITVQADGTNRRRFWWSNEYDLRALSYTNSSYIYAQLNTQDVDVTGAWGDVLRPTYYGNGNTWASSTALNNREDYFVFGVRSPSTLVFGDFLLNATAGGKLNTNYNRSQIYIMGWLHDCIFPTPPAKEFFRYNPCFILEIYNAGTNLGFSTFEGYRPKQKGSGNDEQYLEYRYYDIVCQDATVYQSGNIFMTDLVLCDNVAPYNKIGKVDNRVVAMARGVLEKGRVYQVSNVFGRTGNEEWLCMGHVNPLSYTVPNWVMGANRPAKYYKFWQPNELDYVMMRIYTEAD